MSEWTKDDIDAVYATAHDRFAGALREGRPPVAGESRDPEVALARDVLGCFGELHIAKQLGITWSRAVGQYDHSIPDVGIFHVRAAGQHHYKLILREEDTDNTFPYVLVTTENPPFDLETHGWIYRPDGLRDEWWQAPNGRRGAYFVPQYALSMPL